MYWKKKINLLKTVKFRTALWYALLFATSSMLLFLGIYYTLKSGMIVSVDRQLISLSRQLEDCYVNGEIDNITPPEMNKIPESIKAAARKAVKNLHIKDGWRERNENRSWYEIIGVSGRKSYDISISSGGKVLEIEERILENRIRLLERNFHREVYYQGVNRIFFRLIAPDGKVLAKSDGRSWSKLAHNRDYRRNIPFNRPTTVAVPSRSALRVLEHKLFDGNILEAAVNLRFEESLLRTYWSVFAVFSGTLLLLSAVAGWIIAAKTMKGVDRVSRTAVAISQGDFSRRVAAGGEGEEIDELVLAFNDMLAKIESLIFDLKEVSDNIAHDLRTPLTRIRGIIETTVRCNPVPEDYEIMTGSIVEECDRLIEMINTMLEITRTDSGTADLTFDDVDISLLVEQAYKLFLPLAEVKNIDFRLDVATDKCLIFGDLTRLQRMVANLLDNAIKYTQKGGKVELAVSSADGLVRITVRDNGPGISKTDQTHIFDRFFRGDGSRSQPGNGLGLSLVRAIVKVHNGSMNVICAPGSGSVFELTFSTSSSAVK
jgi:signal transduction histidine kinase